MKKRKHKVVVEVTFEKPVTAKYAKNLIDDTLCSCVPGSNFDYDVVTWKCKEYNRVLRAELAKQCP